MNYFLKSSNCANTFMAGHVLCAV